VSVSSRFRQSKKNVCCIFAGCSVFFSGLDVAGCRIVDDKDEAKLAYEYSIGH
jgi:hypothetical protein